MEPAKLFHKQEKEEGERHKSGSSSACLDLEKKRLVLDHIIINFFVSLFVRCRRVTVKKTLEGSINDQQKRTPGLLKRSFSEQKNMVIPSSVYNKNNSNLI